jgi:hypothetical protein
MKIRTMLIVLCATAYALVAMGQDSTTQPSDSSSPPTSRPETSNPRREFRRSNRRLERRSETTTPTSTSLPAIYDAVAARDIFVKGNQRPPAPPPPGSVSSTPASDPNIPTPSQLVLTGVSLEDNVKVAFLEDQQAYTATRVKIGDPIANGKVVNMTLDSLDYKDASGRIIRVEVGYNLAGGDVWGVSSSPGGPSTQPARGGPRGPGESMEDYLKRRRAGEMSH